MILADQFRPGTFVDAFRFIGDHGSLLLSKTGEHLELSFAALGIALVSRCRSGSGSAIVTAASSSQRACRTSVVLCRASC